MSSEIAFNISKIEEFNLFTLEFDSYLNREFSLLDYSKVKNDYNILLIKLSENIEIYYILQEKETTYIKIICKDILKNIRNIIFNIEFYEDSLKMKPESEKSEKLSIICKYNNNNIFNGSNTIRCYMICLEPYKKLFINPGFFLQNPMNIFDTIFHFRYYTDNHVKFPSMSDGFGLALYIEDNEFIKLYCWLKRRNYISLVKGIDTTMNLSKRSYENIGNQNKEHIEKYLFDEIIMREICSII
jgi:hypothetical protein